MFLLSASGIRMANLCISSSWTLMPCLIWPGTVDLTFWRATAGPPPPGLVGTRLTCSPARGANRCSSPTSATRSSPLPFYSSSDFSVRRRRGEQSRIHQHRSALIVAASLRRGASRVSRVGARTATERRSLQQFCLNPARAPAQICSSAHSANQPIGT